MEFIIGSYLSIENVSCELTFVAKNRREVLDITLGNELMTVLKEVVKQLLPKSTPWNTDCVVFRNTLGLSVRRVGQVDRSATASGL